MNRKANFCEMKLLSSALAVKEEEKNWETKSKCGENKKLKRIKFNFVETGRRVHLSTYNLLALYIKEYFCKNLWKPRKI